MASPPDIQHGTEWEGDFQTLWHSVARNAWLYRFEDVKDLFGRNQRAVRLTPKPADFLGVANGWTGFIECKATVNAVGFPTSMIELSQRHAATLARLAGGSYVFAIKSLQHNKVFLVSADDILPHRGVLPWAKLEPYRWKDGEPCPVFTM